MGTIVSLYLAKVVAIASAFACLVVLYVTLVVFERAGVRDGIAGPVFGSMMLASFVLVPVVYVRTYRALRRRARHRTQSRAGEVAPGWMSGE